MRPRLLFLIAITILAIGIVWWIRRPPPFGVIARGSWVPPIAAPPFPTHTPTPTLTPHNQAEQFIYATMIDHAPAPFDQEVLAKVATYTWVWNGDEIVSYRRIAEVAPTISAAEWDTFRADNQTAMLLPEKLPVRRPLEWETPAELDRLARDSRSEHDWDFYLRLNRPRNDVTELPVIGYMMLSKIHFDSADEEAFAVLRMECGISCSHGILFRFERENDRWELQPLVPLWGENPNETLAVEPPSLVPPQTIIPVDEDDGGRWENEKQVLRAVLEDYCGWDTRTYIIAPTTVDYFNNTFLATDIGSGSSNPAETLEWYQRELPSLREDTWQDFLGMNRAVYEFPTDLGLARDTWLGGEIEPSSPEMCGEFSLSRVGFNQTGSQAMLYYHYYCGLMCLNGGILLLEKEVHGWVVIGNFINMRA